MQLIFAAVPALDREAEARPADLEVGPSTRAFRLQRVRDARAAGDQLPGAIGLLADQRVARALHAVTKSAAFGDDRFRMAVAVEVGDLLDRAGRVAGGTGILAG